MNTSNINQNSVREAYTLYLARIAHPYSAFFPTQAVSHFFVDLLVTSQPPRKMTTLGCQVYIFYYALVNELFDFLHIYYNINFLRNQLRGEALGQPTAHLLIAGIFALPIVCLIGIALIGYQLRKHILNKHLHPFSSYYPA